MSDTHATDEFDDLPADGPVGVHRRSRSPWAPVIPFLLVLIFVPLIAWGVATLIQRNVPEEEIIEVVTQSEEVQSDGEVLVEEDIDGVVLPPSDLPTAAPDDPSAEGEEPAAQTPEAAEVDTGARVAVLNGTSVAGYAGQVADQVAGAGFTNVAADNATVWPTDQNTVYYPNAASRATAEAVAAAAGIGSVVEAGYEGFPDQIVVFLAN